MKVTIGAFLVVMTFTLLEYFQGGVITHYFLADDDLPGFSNWWGLLTVPALAYLVSHLRRKEDPRSTITRFVIALVFGATISTLWVLGLERILPFLMLSPLFLSLFIRIHRGEILLGFVIGMIYAFGGVLPIIIGSVLMTACFIVNKLVQLIRGLIVSK